MRILSILTYYAPHWTGLTQHAQRVAEGLAARGHSVTVLTTRHSPELARDDLINGVRVVRLQPVARFSRGMITPAFPLAAARLIAEHDLVQIHTPLPEAPLVGLLCRLQSRPLLMTHHGDVVMPPGPFNQFVQRAAFTVLHSAGMLANAVTSYSRDYANNSALLRHFRSKLSYVYPPVDLPPPDREAAAAWRSELGLDGKLLIGFAGRWVQEKGFDYLLQALPQIRAAYPEAHLVYAGEQQVVYDNFYTHCKPLIDAQHEHLTFLGLIRDPQQMANFYAMCDLFTLPSRTDMMALVQVESLLSGTPVVATDIPGARVVLQETGMGRLVPPHDPNGLAAGIVEVLGHPECYRTDRERLRTIFDVDRSLDQYEAIMQRISPPAAQQPAATTLTDDDQQKLGVLLRNEADMAFRRRAHRLLDWLELRDGERVFDCGCGMGFYLMTIGALRQLNLVGLDGDVERLHWAQREQVPAGLLSGDILKLPFPDASFDKVLMSEVLEHISDDRVALSEIFRVLKPGGILALSVPHARYPFWWDPINHIWIALGGQPIRSGPIAGIWSNHERLYDPADLVERMRAAGFELEIVEEATHYSFPLIHFLVYGIGKPLIEHNLLPDNLRKSADRFSGQQNSGSLLNPINLGLSIFRLIDRLNDQPPDSFLRRRARTFVNVLVKARKPASR
jgi:glycosyltransferase involved in cell wall biosynthesis/ubiquinone/menaquinone biosynthesis C-methylase UbiE